MNRPERTWPDDNALWRLISQKVLKIETCNFDKILIKVLNLCYLNLKSTSSPVWKLFAFRQSSNFGNFQQIFFYQNFWLEGNFKYWWFHPKQLGEICHSELYIQLKIYFFMHEINFLGEKMEKNQNFFTVIFFELLPKFSDFVNSLWKNSLDQNLSEYIQSLF